MSKTILSNTQQQKLDEMIKENNIEDYTENIKINNHSDLIRNDIKEYILLSKRYNRLKESNPKEFDMMCNKKCSFLFNNYTQIYNKLIKDSLNLEIMDKFLNTLKDIEKGEINQHEASYIIGDYLKKIYIDSAINEDKQKEKKYRKKTQNKPQEAKSKEISYKDYKILNTK